MKSFRAKPVGWRYESYRHYLAAKGVSTNKYFSRRYAAQKPALQRGVDNLFAYMDAAAADLRAARRARFAEIDRKRQVLAEKTGTELGTIRSQTGLKGEEAEYNMLRGALERHRAAAKIRDAEQRADLEKSRAEQELLNVQKILEEPIGENDPRLLQWLGEARHRAASSKKNLASHMTVARYYQYLKGQSESLNRKRKSAEREGDSKRAESLQKELNKTLREMNVAKDTAYALTTMDPNSMDWDQAKGAVERNKIMKAALKFEAVDAPFLTKENRQKINEGAREFESERSESQRKQSPKPEPKVRQTTAASEESSEEEDVPQKEPGAGPKFSKTSAVWKNMDVFPMDQKGASMKEDTELDEEKVLRAAKQAETSKGTGADRRWDRIRSEVKTKKEMKSERAVNRAAAGADVGQGQREFKGFNTQGPGLRKMVLSADFAVKDAQGALSSSERLAKQRFFKKFPSDAAEYEKLKANALEYVREAKTQGKISGSSKRVNKVLAKNMNAYMRTVAATAQRASRKGGDADDERDDVGPDLEGA